MLVKKLMTIQPCTCHEQDSLEAPARIMWEHDCGVVPVVDDSGALVGIVTDRDVCMAAYTQGKPLADLPVTRTMSRDVMTCRADDDVVIAERTMRDGRIRRLPVVDGHHRIVGLISLNDLAREAIASGHAGAPRPADLTQTLAAIGRSRRGGEV